MAGGWLAGLANSLPALPDFAGMGMNYLGTGLITGNWGGTSKERKNQIHDIRTLRRREYQDMVHSLTEAGLNPILAVGATPGHATAQQVAGQNLPQYQGGTGGSVGTAVAANRQAGVSEGKAPSEINKNIAGTGLLQDQAINTQLGRAGILQAYEKGRAEIESILQNTKTAFALEKKYGQDAITGGYSAKKLETETNQLNEYGAPWASWEKGLMELLREGLRPDAKGESSAKSFLEKHREMRERRSEEGPTAGSLWRPYWRD